MPALGDEGGQRGAARPTPDDDDIELFGNAHLSSPACRGGLPEWAYRTDPIDVERSSAVGDGSRTLPGGTPPATALLLEMESAGMTGTGVTRPGAGSPADGSDRAG
ncbi:hypothetical protein GCM10020218_097100 [Dactylosporangium vinaceum]